jgi:hypothetical protein
MNYALGLLLIPLSPFVLTWYTLALLWQVAWQRKREEPPAEQKQGEYYRGENTYGYRR